MNLYWLAFVVVLAVAALRHTLDLWSRARLGRFATLIEPEAREWLAEVHAHLARDQWRLSRVEALTNLEALVEHSSARFSPTWVHCFSN